MNAAVADGAPPRILVVDDDRLVLATVCAGLRQAGFEVLEADNGDDAILLARAERPQLAILDMRMQGKSGLDVARYLRANTRTGFLFLSAFNDTELVEEARQAGALDYLVKPIDVQLIVPAVRAALASWQQRLAATPAPVTPREQDPPEVLLAIGILMGRQGLDRPQARAALEREAREAGETLTQRAVRLLAAAGLPGLKPG